MLVSTSSPTQALDAKLNESVKSDTRPSYSEEDLYYLSRTIYGESRGEGIEGMKHVGSVIINRVKSPQFPKSVKSVVLQRNQFTVWSKTNPNYDKLITANDRLMKTAEKIALELLTSGPINHYLYFETASLGRRGYKIGKHTFR